MMTCDYCGESVDSVYTFQHEGVRYFGHKRCMGAPMVRKLTQSQRTHMFPPIAITGCIRAGKTEVARYLTEAYGYTEFAFADEMKRYAHEIFDVPLIPKPRELYQFFGQAMRQRDPDVWVRKCFDRIAWDDAGGPYLISDLRVPNEYGRCRAEGYVIIRVNAPEEMRRQRAMDAGDAFDSDSMSHETEKHVDLFAVDYDLYNVGTIESLRGQIDAIMSVIVTEG